MEGHKLQVSVTGWVTRGVGPFGQLRHQTRWLEQVGLVNAWSTASVLYEVAIARGATTTLGTS